MAGAFTAFEAATETRFAADGMTPIGRPRWSRTSSATCRRRAASTWDLAYDHRLSPRWALHVQPARPPWRRRADPQSGHGARQRTAGHEQRRTIELPAGGSGRAHDARHAHGPQRVLRALESAENLNAFVDFYGAVLEPIVGEDAYAPAAADAPNRLFVRGQVMPTTRWMLLGTFDGAAACRIRW